MQYGTFHQDAHQDRIRARVRVRVRVTVRTFDQDAHEDRSPILVGADLRLGLASGLRLELGAIMGSSACRGLEDIARG